MERSTELETAVRVLGLGNEMLADDAFGIEVAEQLRERFGTALDVVTSAASGFELMDHLLGVRRLLIIDTVVTGRAAPGTISLFTADQLRSAGSCTPHGAGLFDALETARELQLPVPSEIVIIATEARDCTTLGGPMHPDVEAAVGIAAGVAARFLTSGIWQHASAAAGAYVQRS